MERVYSVSDVHRDHNIITLLSILAGTGTYLVVPRCTSYLIKFFGNVRFHRYNVRLAVAVRHQPDRRFVYSVQRFLAITYGRPIGYAMISW